MDYLGRFIKYLFTVVKEARAFWGFVGVIVVFVFLSFGVDEALLKKLVAPENLKELTTGVDWTKKIAFILAALLFVLATFTVYDKVQKEKTELAKDLVASKENHVWEIAAVQNSAAKESAERWDTQTEELEQFSKRVDVLQRKLAPGLGQPRYTIDPSFKVPQEVLDELKTLEGDVDKYLLRTDKSWFRALKVGPDIVDGGQTHQQLRDLSVVRNKIAARHEYVTEAKKNLGL